MPMLQTSGKWATWTLREPPRSHRTVMGVISTSRREGVYVASVPLAAAVTNEAVSEHEKNMRFCFGFFGDIKGGQSILYFVFTPFCFFSQADGCNLRPAVAAAASNQRDWKRPRLVPNDQFSCGCRQGMCRTEGGKKPEIKDNRFFPDQWDVIPV